MTFGGLVLTLASVLVAGPRGGAEPGGAWGSVGDRFTGLLAACRGCRPTGSEARRGKAGGKAARRVTFDLRQLHPVSREALQAHHDY